MIDKTLADRYRVTERLYRGRYLSTFLAVDTAYGTEVEVDILAVRTTETPITVRRLGEILDVAMQVRGPHVSTMHCWGEEVEEGSIYIVREKAGGASLAEVLACTGELPPRQVVGITAAAVEVLAEAYGRDLFYLGLNPCQVLLDDRGGVKLSRVGFGWILEEMEPELAARVSPYRAPETDGGKEGSRTSDVYSLAVMVREMLPDEESGGRLGSLLEMATDLIPKRRPSSPRLLLEELGAGRYGGGGVFPPLDTNSPEASSGNGSGLAFLKTASSIAGLAQRPHRRTLRNLLLILAGGLTLWLAFAAAAGLLGGKASEEPQAPASLDEKVTLPDLQGLTAAEAEGILEGMGLRSTSREAPSRLWSAGRVAAQEPAEGSALRPGDTVCLIISSGREKGTDSETDGGEETGIPDPSSSPGQVAEPSPQAVTSQPAPRAPSSPLSTTASNLPPRAVPAISTNSGSAPLYVTMDGSASYDPDGSIVRYVWYCGDGTVIEGARAQHVYDPVVIPARFQVVLEVYDSGGMRHASVLILEVF